ncbi:MAG: hypothetical protein WD048_03980 [Chitinophagales bacterium]
MRYAWLIWLLIALYGFTPATINSLWTRPNKTDLIITGQECGCPCPEARVLKGAIEIPENILDKHPNIHEYELTLTGNSPFEPYNYEIGHSEILIEGKVIGIDTILCSPTDCEVVPKFEVKKWTLTSYSARFWTWNKTTGISYLLGVPLGFSGLLIFTIVRRKKK